MDTEEARGEGGGGRKRGRERERGGERGRERGEREGEGEGGKRRKRRMEKCKTTSQTRYNLIFVHVLAIQARLCKICTNINMPAPFFCGALKFIYL